MDPAPIRPPSRPERRSIIVVTLTFIVLSAIAHFLLGGAFHTRWVHEGPQQRPMPLTIDHFPTPRPSPVRPTPTPRPQISRVDLRPRQHSTHRPAHRAALPPRVQPPPVPHSTAGSNTDTIQPATSSPPETPGSSSAPLDARDIIVSARFIHQVEPDYPDIARQEGAEGTVIVLVTIDPDGSPSDVRVWQSSGNDALDRAAEQAARESTYAPPEVNGEPATQTYRIIYTFYLD
jgi:protein TonB